MPDRDNPASEGLGPLPDDAIAATNVLPALEVSLALGVSADDLRAATGLDRDLVQTPGAYVTGAATYAHFEFMAARPRLGEFLVAAASQHQVSSLGVVGLACKTVETLGEAMDCHQRFQTLTNQTASYRADQTTDALVLQQTRKGPSRPGRDIASDYALLVAVQLLRDNAAAPVEIQALVSPRAQIPDAERAPLEAFVGAPLRCEPGRSALHLHPRTREIAVKTADPEMARYFLTLLESATPTQPGDPPLVADARVAIREQLPTGTPTVATVAKSLGLGARTLQRRLGERQVRFGELLDETRRALADGYLANVSLSLTEVAYLLGFQDQASFFRAFKRWTGTTPGARRRQVLG